MPESSPAAAQILELSPGLAEALLLHAFEAVVIVDSTGPAARILFATPVLAEMLGRPLEWLIGRDRGEIECAPIVNAAQTRLLRRDGCFVDCRMRIVELPDGHAALYYLATPVAAPSARVVDRAGQRTLEHLLEALRRDWSVAQRTRASVALMRFEIDAFDAYVEVYGRASAENCARQVSNVLFAGLRRASDTLARSADGEFLVLATSMDIEPARAHAEAIVNRVRALALHHPRSTTGKHVSMSAGVVCAVPPPQSTCEELLAASVRALRAAQGAGGHRVAVAGIDDSATVAPD